MSDPETGDSELPENPDPEEDADMSATCNTDLNTNSRFVSENAEAETRTESVATAFQPCVDISEVCVRLEMQCETAQCIKDSFDHNDLCSASVENKEMVIEKEFGECAFQSLDNLENKDACNREKIDLPATACEQSSPKTVMISPEYLSYADISDVNGELTPKEESLYVCNSNEEVAKSHVFEKGTSHEEEAYPEDELLTSNWQMMENMHQNIFLLDRNRESSDQEDSPPEDELSIASEPSLNKQISEYENVHSSCSKISSNDTLLMSNLIESEVCAQSLAAQNHETKVVDLKEPANAVAFTEMPNCLEDRVQIKQLGEDIEEKDDDQIPECDRELSSALDQVSSSSAGSTGTSTFKKKKIAEDFLCDDNRDETEKLLPVERCIHNSASNEIDTTLSENFCDDNMHSNINSASKAEIKSSLNACAYPDKNLIDKTQDSEDEDLLTKLDEELHYPSLSVQALVQQAGISAHIPLNGLKQIDAANSEMCKQFEEQLLQLQEQILLKDREIHRLNEEKRRQRQVSQEVMLERDRYKAELVAMKDRNPDDLYLPQIKELEYTIAQLQTEIRQQKDKLTAHDAAAKRAISTMQNEMKARIDQITKVYEEGAREKDSMVIKFAEAENRNIEAKRTIDRLEAKIRDLLKEKEFTANKVRTVLTEKQKAVTDLEAKNAEMAILGKEMEKLKEDLSSSDYRIKWFQNKLKAELDAHKETKGNMERTVAKLKEAKEETEQIRLDCQAIVKTYQESEEVRSNSLDKELKIKETELLIQKKEKSDTEEIHLKTKRELDLLKIQHKDTLEELITLKHKVQCLEEERMQNEQLQNKYQSIIQNQKTDNASMQKKMSEMQCLQEDFERAQDMIKTLDREICDLKMTNRDLQKDIEGCQARESKMLSLQSELSRTNALMRSENTNFNNQVVTLSGEVQKMKMDIQDLETRYRNAMDQLEEEINKRKEETGALSAQLVAKIQECEEYKQKWEDEKDSNKTLKRKHVNNVKDLTRQLQHAKKRLEAYECGNGERDSGGMGSRTNSNASLNSADNSNHHPHSSNHHTSSLQNHYSGPQVFRGISQESEFPVITEQVEVDKQVLIERIVRLQKSHARKNEKLEFLEEHIQQLVTEIKKKNKLIQGYVIREESGTLASDDMDANKLAVQKEVQALLARKGGIMASVYSMHQQDGAMTLDLSLEINKKLQAVLEDTLLKNMTLKENIDTLGGEIARLSQENRHLQLYLQELQAH